MKSACRKHVLILKILLLTRLSLTCEDVCVEACWQNLPLTFSFSPSMSVLSLPCLFLFLIETQCFFHSSLYSCLFPFSLIFSPITCPIPSSLPFHYHRLFWHFLLALFSLMAMGILYAALLSIIKVEIWYCSSGQIQKHFNIILISVDSNYSTSLWGTLWNVILNTFKRYAICHSG